MEKKLSPLERVAREMTEHCDLTEQEVEQALRDLLSHLMGRASQKLVDDDGSLEALAASRQYWVFAELVAQFGTALIAFDDIEGAVAGPLN